MPIKRQYSIKRKYMDMPRQVITVDGDGKWYETAIFIVNGDVPPKVNLADEAERIVGDYGVRGRVSRYENMMNPPAELSYKKKASKLKRNFDGIINFILVCCILIVLGLLLAL
jgi:hypothetical protein